MKGSQVVLSCADTVLAAGEDIVVQEPEPRLADTPPAGVRSAARYVESFEHGGSAVVCW
jgi:hypothetical protein